MKLIVGLGNPGKKYEKTRHNVGFMAINLLHKKLKNHNINNWELSKKFNAEISGCTISGDKIILAKPMTFMNASGQSVQMLMNYYKILPNNLIIIHDDKDIPLGEYKIQADRGHAGHNGVHSIMDHIASQKFMRFRIGIASSNEKKMQDIPKFVLDNFGIFDKRTLNEVLEKCSDELVKVIS